MPASDSPPKPIVILGPTAGGKSALAVALAQQLDGQIIGADSMQIYRHMDAGTAKPTHEERKAVPHHLIDIAEPTEPYSVNDWLSDAQQTIDQLISQKKQPIIVGGTNLYLKALLEGLFEGPSSDSALRDELASLAGPELHERLVKVDPASAERIHMNDTKRLTRALEVYQLTGKPISEWQQQWQNNPADQNYTERFHLVGLQWPTPAINERINLRVKAMFHPQKVEPELAKAVCLNGESLPDETSRLQAAGLLGEQARQALGYKQVLEAIAGQMTMDDAFEKTKIQTRRFAKNQRTWLKRFVGVHWLDCKNSPITDLAKQAISHIRGG